MSLYRFLTVSLIARLEDADYDRHSLSMLQKIAGALNQKVEIKLRGDRVLRRVWCSCCFSFQEIKGDRLLANQLDLGSVKLTQRFIAY